jgi:thioredoxin-related protein
MQLKSRNKTRRIFHGLLLAMTCTGILSVTAHADESAGAARQITLAESFAADSRVSSNEQLPIVVFVSQTGCQFCEALRKQVLFPMLRSGQFQEKMIFRELSLDAGFVVEDFDGAMIAGSDFAARYGATLTPTLVYLDPDGNELEKKRVGISNIEYYGFYLLRSIKAATTKLMQP